MGLSGFLTWLIKNTTERRSRYYILNNDIHVFYRIWYPRISSSIYMYNNIKDSLANQRFFNNLYEILNRNRLINTIDKIYIDLENPLHQISKYYDYSVSGDSHKIIELLIHYMKTLYYYNNDPIVTKKAQMMLTIDEVPIEKTRDKFESTLYYRDRLYNVFQALWKKDVTRETLETIKVRTNKKGEKFFSKKLSELILPVQLDTFNFLKGHLFNNITVSKHKEGEHNIIKQIEEDIRSERITGNILVDAPDSDTFILILMNQIIMNKILTDTSFNIYLIMSRNEDSCLFNIREVINELFIERIFKSIPDLNPEIINVVIKTCISNFGCLSLLTNTNDFINKKIFLSMVSEDRINDENLQNSITLYRDGINIYELIYRESSISLLQRYLLPFYRLNVSIDIDKYIIVPNVTFGKSSKDVTEIVSYLDELVYKKYNNIYIFIKWLISYYSIDILNENNVYQTDPTPDELTTYKRELLGKIIGSSAYSSYGGGISLNQKYTYYLSKYNLM